MEEILYHEISVKKAPLLIFLVPLLFLTALQVYLQYTTILLLIGSFFLLLGVLFYYLLGKRKIIIDSNGITNQLLFDKEQHIPWQEISNSAVDWHNYIIYSSTEWEFNNKSGTALSITLYNYSGKDLQLIAEMLLSKCPNAKVDQKIRDLADGKFPWYIFLS